MPRPGEMSLAHNGVLFLDELPEFRRSALEAMRQPLEDGFVNVTRSNVSVRFPARFMLVAAMNPCPCGYLSDLSRRCSCGSSDVRKYLSRLSGPLLDRIDIHVDVPAVRVGELLGVNGGETSESMRRRVEAAREVQTRRFGMDSWRSCNAHMNAKEVRKLAGVRNEAISLLRASVEKLGLSARSFYRTLKVARTIADLAGEEEVAAEHVAEAIQYRALDRNAWRFAS